jgi:hypothetical protein
MEKTKLNISVTLFAAAAALLGLYGGYVITGILVGYALLKEENLWLKKFCVKVLMLMLAFSAISTLIGLVPNILEIFYSFLRIFGVNFYLSFIHNVCNTLQAAFSVLRPVAFILLTVFALLGKDIKIPGVDKFVEKHIGA